MPVLLLLLHLLMSLAHAGEPAKYRVGPGDTLEVKTYGEDDMSGVFGVNDAGELEFPLLGAVQVDGLTTAEVAAVLTERLSDGYLVEPNVTVSLEDYQSQAVQVLGAVARPGVFYLKRPTSVLEIISEAGGVVNSGVEEVQLTHADGSVHALRYARLVNDKAGTQMLAGGDVVFVPEAIITVIGHVQSPGEVVFRDNMTVATCIAAAGGALDTAALARVFILRGEERIRVNLRAINLGRANDVPVRTGDRILVQESIF